MKLAAVLAAVVAVIAACASSSLPPQAVPTIDPSAAQITELARRAPCHQTQTSDNEASRAEIARYAAVAVVLCDYPETRAYPGEGLWTVRIRRVATRGLGRLLFALKRHDDSPSSGACPGVGYGPLSLLLTDGSTHYLHPRMPRDECGGPQRMYSEAEKALVWRTVSVDRVALSRSPASLASGCEMRWKNEIHLLGPSVKTSAGGPVFSRRPRTTRKICIYRTGSDQDIGEFVRSVRLSGSQVNDFDAAVSGPGPTGDCQAQHRFAVVFGPGNRVNIELGGCWRVLRVDSGAERFGSANAAELERLLGMG
jgi:hypothetical protein